MGNCNKTSTPRLKNEKALNSDALESYGFSKDL